MVRMARLLVVAAWAALAGGCSHRLLKPLRPMPVHPMGSFHSVAREDSAPADGGAPVARPTAHKWYAKPNGRAWKHIVIHHSASDSGSAASFDRYHRIKRGWDELGYHFVIDNGHGGPDGRVEVGSRWVKQKHGAHCGGTPGNEYNEHGIGICLVGTFTAGMPTKAQLASLRKLLLYLMRTHRIGENSVIGHRDAPFACTACPGDAMHRYICHTLRPQLTRALAEPLRTAARGP